MLGHKQMSHQGTAEVLSVTVKGNSLGAGFIKYELILDVRPDGAEPFRTKVTHHFDLEHSPTRGDELKVRCDPASKAVELETKGDPRYDPKAAKAARKAHEQALLDGTSSQDHASPAAASTSDDPEIAELERLEQLEAEAQNSEQ